GGELRFGGEHSCSWTDDEAFGGEEVFAVVMADVGSFRCGAFGERLEEGVEVVRCGDRRGAGTGDGALRHPGEDGARSDLDEGRDAGFVELVEDLTPTHRAGELSGEQLGPVVAVRVGGCVD